MTDNSKNHRSRLSDANADSIAWWTLHGSKKGRCIVNSKSKFRSVLIDHCFLMTAYCTDHAFPFEFVDNKNGWCWLYRPTGQMVCKAKRHVNLYLTAAFPNSEVLLSVIHSGVKKPYISARVFNVEGADFEKRVMCWLRRHGVSIPNPHLLTRLIADPVFGHTEEDKTLADLPTIDDTNKMLKTALQSV